MTLTARILADLAQIWNLRYPISRKFARKIVSRSSWSVELQMHENGVFLFIQIVKYTFAPWVLG